MGHFMANHPANASKVHCWIGLKTKERRLKNTRWENNLIISRVIISIHCLRRKYPFGFIYLFSYFCYSSLKSPLTNLCNILKKRDLSTYSKLRIILPLVRISHLYRELIEFFHSFLLSSIAHPSYLLDMFGKTFL